MPQFSEKERKIKELQAEYAKLWHNIEQSRFTIEGQRRRRIVINTWRMLFLLLVWFMTIASIFIHLENYKQNSSTAALSDFISQYGFYIFIYIVWILALFIFSIRFFKIYLARNHAKKEHQKKLQEAMKEIMKEF